jgi:hypothetical protein
VRFDANGQLDPEFSNDGAESVRGPTRYFFEPHRMDITASASGEVYGAMRVPLNVGLVKLGADGTPEAAFGTDGYAHLPAFKPSEEVAWPTATIATPGGTLTGGTTARTRTDFRDSIISAQDFAVARTDAAGTLDFAFGGGDGTAAFDFFTGGDEAEDMAIAPDGGILQVGGAANGFSPDDIAVAKYTDEPGRIDADADGRVNRRDPCPAAYAKRHRGCPRLGLKLTLKWQSAVGGQFVGKFTSKFLGCLRERVAVKRIKDGEDAIVGKDRADRISHVFRIAQSPRKGRFYAQLIGRDLADRGVCSANKSPVVTVP